MIKQLTLLALTSFSLYGISHVEAQNAYRDAYVKAINHREFNGRMCNKGNAHEELQKYAEEIERQINCSDQWCIYCGKNHVMDIEDYNIKYLTEPYYSSMFLLPNDHNNVDYESNYTNLYSKYDEEYIERDNAYSEDEYSVENTPKLQNINDINIQEEVRDILEPMQFPEEIQHEIDEFMLKYLLDSCPQKLLENVELIAQTGICSDTYYRLMNKALLVGPPGSGKTTLGKAIALKTDRPYLYIRVTDLFNEYKDSGTANLNRLFEPLLKYPFPCVIQLDEFTALTDRFENKNNSEPGIVEHFWMTLDKCMKQPGMLIICSCNTTKKIPATIRNRFPGQEFYIPLPRLSVRKNMLQHYLSQYSALDNDTLETVSKNTDGFSYRELQEIIQGAINYADLESMRKGNAGNTQVGPSHLLRSFNNVNATHSKALEEQQSDEGPYSLKALIAQNTIPALSMTLGLALQYWCHKQQCIMTEKFKMEEMIAEETFRSKQLEIMRTTSQQDQKNKNTREVIFLGVETIGKMAAIGAIYKAIEIAQKTGNTEILTSIIKIFI